MSDQESPRPISDNPHSRAGRHPILVVGGGVIGAACASFLAEQGAPVLLIEQGEFGKGCSYGNCGYVSPSHVLPLCKPGAVWGATKTFFRRNSPLQMRWRFDPTYWRWMWMFARRCNQIDMVQSGHALNALLQSSRRIYGELFDSGTLEDCEWETKGILFVHQNRQHFESFAKTDALIREEYGLGAVAYQEAELLAMEPALKPGVAAGAWYYDCDAQLRPDKLMRAWRQRLEQQGVIVRENCALTHLEGGHHRVNAVMTTSGRIEVDQLVLATGAWTRLLRQELQAFIPIEPGKGYSMTMPRPEHCPRYPMIFEDHRVAVTPFQSGYRLGSTMEFAGYDSSLSPRRLKLLTDAATLYLHDPGIEPVVESWYGWRPMSADGVPLIGRLPKWNNGWLAAGHSMLGVSMATATGRLISEMLTGAHPHIDPHPYRISRF